MDHGGRLCAMASEEDERHRSRFPTQFKRGKYVLLFDPLDGSSNIDVNVSIGTIFSVLRRVTPGAARGTLEDCCSRARKQVAAGYVIYGSSTMLVYTTGHGVHGFTLDPSIGEFLLSHPNIRIPERGRYLLGERALRAALGRAGAGADAPLPRTRRQREAMNVRYIGSLVADFHRNLLVGGVFAYPADTKTPQGKLRLLYECNPLAFIVRAGRRRGDRRRTAASSTSCPTSCTSARRSSSAARTTCEIGRDDARET